jgi:hypothetical protein
MTEIWKYLVEDSIGVCDNFITENIVTKNKDYMVSGPFMVMGVRNHNR